MKSAGNTQGDTDTMITGHEVWLARKNAGLTQTQLSKQLGVSNATISYWERKAGGEVKPSNGAGPKLEEFVGENLQPVMVVDVPEFTADTPINPGAYFNFDRAPETKRRWWQRFGRGK